MAPAHLGTVGFWRDRRVLVTGATGLLGTAVVRGLLDMEAEVVCLVRDWVPNSELVRSNAFAQATVVRGDVRDRDVIERALGEYEVETVFHLAAQTTVGVANRNSLSTFETNVGGTWSVLEAARRSPAVKQLVVASSDKAYGDSEALPYREDHPLRGRHPYDASKACADLVTQSYAGTYGVPAAITRCGNFFGGGDLNWNRLVPGTIRSVLRGDPPVIRSDGNYIRDYIYVADGAAANILLAEKLAADPDLRGQAFNFSNEVQLTVHALVDRILALMGSSLKPVVLNEAVHEIRAQHLSTEKARRALGWKPRYALDDGLRHTIDWYRAYFGAKT